ncbi:MAG: exodeoxyribonuclease VII small subunit [Defluviitaleaceae bacterium]|nr:exodeoxyribonuclease VII small subunit [Defluviitaleaceae bacterium]
MKIEKKLEKLSKIVEQVEDSQTPLDKAISLYKEGVDIAKECGEILERYESDILVLQKSALGFSTPAFDE